MGFSRCARGDFGVRLQGSLRTDPASLGVFWRSAGSILHSLRRLWGGWGFRALREGFCCSPPRLALDRSRFAWRMGRSAGTVLRSLRRLREGWGFRAVREGILVFASKARYGPIPLRLEYLVRSAGTVLRSLRRLWGGWGVRSAPTGHCKPARGETPGMAHERSVLKERRIPPDRLWAWSLQHLRTPFCCGSEGHVRRLLTWRRISPSASASSSVLPSPGLLQPGSGGFLLRLVRRGFQ